MMEQTYFGEGHCHSVFIAGIYYGVVPYGAAGLCDKFDAALLCPVYIV